MVCGDDPEPGQRLFPGCNSGYSHANQASGNFPHSPPSTPHLIANLHSLSYNYEHNGSHPHAYDNPNSDLHRNSHQDTYPHGYAHTHPGI